MSSVAENTNRIAKNTVLLYIRMLFGMVVSLYTSRVIFATLGVQDMGITEAVGGFVVLFSIISSSLSASVSRFLTYEIGKGNIERLKTIFATSVIIHLALATIIFILAETVGLYFVNKLNIPVDRVYAANWIYQISLLSIVVGLIQIPYTAVIIAREHMNVFAYIGIASIVIRLFIVLFIAYGNYNADKLILYNLLLFIVSILMQVITYIYCRKHFEETTFKFELNKKNFTEMSSFAGWNFIGSTAAVLKDQGANVLINLFFGPLVNGARALANTVNSAVLSFSGSFMTALNPQITKNYASGENEYMFSLVMRGSKFSFFVIMIVGMPILLETDFIIDIWQDIPIPAHTINFIRLVLILSFIDVLSNTLITTQLAIGKIKTYQIFVGGMLLMNFPLSYVCFKLGLQPESIYFVAIFVAVACLFLRLYFLKKMINFPSKEFIKKVCLRVLVVFSLSVIIPLFLYFMLDYGWSRVIVVSSASVMCSMLSAFYVGCTKNERIFIIQKIVNLKERLVK